MAVPQLVYGVNATGFSFDASWYVNHGASPNVEFVRRGDGEFNGYVTTRRVAAGEELLTCYRKSFPEMHAAFSQQPGAEAVVDVDRGADWRWSVAPT